MPDDAAAARLSTPASALTASGVRRGAALGWPLLAGSVVGGLAMGAALRALGFDLPTAAAWSALVYSGSAQAVSTALWTTPPPVAALVLAALAVNARYLVMGAALRARFPRVPQSRALPALFLLADANWALVEAEARRGRPDLGLLIGAGLVMWAGWVGGTALGHTLGALPPGPLSAGAAFVTLGFLVIYLPAQWDGPRRTLPGWVVASTVAVLALASGLAPHWAMLAGGGAGAAVAYTFAREDEPGRDPAAHA